MINILKKFINKDEVFHLFKNNGSNVVNIIERNNLVLISIKEDLDFNSFTNKIKKTNKNFNYNLIPIKMYITDTSDILNCKLKKQLIWFEYINGKTWIIAKTSNEIKISLREYYDEYIDEVILEIKDDKYKIIKCIHDSELSTRFVKWYPEFNKDVSNYFSLGQEEAMFYMSNLLSELENTKILSEDVINEIYNVVDMNKENKIKILIKE